VVSVGNSTEVVEAIIRGNVELGFVEGPEGELQDPCLAVEMVGQDDLVMVVSANHPWASRENLTVDDLIAGKWVLREDGAGTRAAIVKALDALGAPYSKLDIAIELPSNEAVLAAVLAGAGATVLSARVCANAVKAGTLKCPPVSLAPRAFLAVQHADRYRSRAVSALLEIIRTRAHCDFSARPERTLSALPRLARRGPPRYTFYSWRHDPATTILSDVDASLGDCPFINCCAKPQQGRLRKPARGPLMALKR